ncbi:MAG: MotA/TolQ/ExbB proton channel family protein [Thiobacillaceae bacterium]|jgi:biopolymer transport protein ExbB
MLNLTTSPAVNISLLILLVFSIVTWSLIFAKFWQQTRTRQQNDRLKNLFWNARDFSDAERSAAGQEGMLARLCQMGFSTLRKAEYAAENLALAGNRQEILERNLRMQAQKEQHRLESGLMALASIGSTAPFIGLFGTVWGIKNALAEISLAGTATLNVVAGPVGDALIATAVGIATAVPAVLAYNYGVRRVRLSVAELDQFSTDFLNLAAKSEFRVEPK